jgi:hypothetical protein
MLTAQIPPISPANLCHLCQEISFNDQKHGIDQKRSPEGPNGEGVIIPLETTRKDLLPDLPGLRISAEKGCDFCAFLRTALLKRRLAQNTKEVEISMSFTWATELDYIWMYGLTFLTVAVASNDGIVASKVVFDIGSYDGMRLIQPFDPRPVLTSATSFKDKSANTDGRCSPCSFLVGSCTRS